MHQTSTIIAPATPRGVSALAVLRCSGPRALAVLSALAGPPPAGGWPPARMLRRRLRAADGTPIDDALVVAFRGPRSATGEDVAEFHCHGNPVIVASVMAAAVAAGAKLAEAGAFTRRAVLAGKLDLPGVEALSDLLEAVSPQGVAQALTRLDGALQAWAEATRSELVALRAEIEAAVDFPDEGLETATSAALVERVLALAARIGKEAERGRRARVWQRGAAVVLVGAPNVGKSTILNRLLGEERAIVSPWAGTTRDYLESGATLAGIPVRLIDTAGIRETTDALEADGVRRSLARAREADLVVWVQAPGCDPDPALDAFLRSVEPERVLAVWNKADLGRPRGAMLAISAKTGDGIEQLVTAIAERVRAPSDAIVGSLRQEADCLDAQAALGRAATCLRDGAPPEIVAEELRVASKALERLCGVIDAEAVLDRLFATFCVGK